MCVGYIGGGSEDEDGYRGYLVVLVVDKDDQGRMVITQAESEREDEIKGTR